jgi:ribonuclease R
MGLRSSDPAGREDIVDDSEFLALFQNHPEQSFNLREVFAHVGVPLKREKTAKRILKALVEKSAIERSTDRRYRLARAESRIEGVVEFDDRGNPFVLVAIKKSRPERFPLSAEPPYIPKRHDRVSARLLPGRKGQLSALALELLERPETRHVGIFRRLRNMQFVELEPTALSKRAMGPRQARSLDVQIPREHRTPAEDGMLVEVEYREAPERGEAPIGRVVQIIGKPGERETEFQRLLIEHGLDVPFPPDVIESAEALPDTPLASERAGRTDLRTQSFVTIDGETAKDFDDAVFAEATEEGYRASIAIADVAHYIIKNAPLDREARRRGTSTYLTDRAIPMLPEKLSNGLCSLRPNEDRLTMVVVLDIDQGGRVRGTNFFEGVINSKARLTYTQVAEALEGRPDTHTKPILPMLLLCSKIASRLFEHRLRRGAIDLDLPEPEIQFDEEGQPIGAKPRPRNDAHRVIEELMIAANEAVARFFVERDLPSIFRIHDAPDPEKLETFGSLCEQLGVRTRLGKNPGSADIAAVLESLLDTSYGSTLHMLLLRSLNQARYEAECTAHFGLASSAYLHFTSPIRRYPDLIVHRALKAQLHDMKPPHALKDLQKIAESSSENERRATSAGRKSVDIDRALVAERYLGHTLEARVVGLQNFGIFAAVDAPFIEGLIPIHTLPEDYYVLHESGAFLVGERTGRRFSLGETITIEVAHVNVSRGQVEFRIIMTRIGEAMHSKDEPRARRPSLPPPRARDRPLQRDARTPKPSRTGKKPTSGTAGPQKTSRRSKNRSKKA